MLFLALVIAWFWSAPAVAHKPSDSYLSFTVRDQVVSGQWDIALRDLDYAIGLDADGDGAITWGELKGRHDAIATYALGHLRVSSGGRALCRTGGGATRRSPYGRQLRRLAVLGPLRRSSAAPGLAL